MNAFRPFRPLAGSALAAAVVLSAAVARAQEPNPNAVPPPNAPPGPAAPPASAPPATAPGASAPPPTDLPAASSPQPPVPGPGPQSPSPLPPSKLGPPSDANVAQPALPSAAGTTGPSEPTKETSRPLPYSTPLASDITHQSDFMDTRLTWTFGDDDITKATGEAFPLSPKPNVGDRPQYRLFFDNLNSRFAGRENLTHLVLYKKLPGYIPNLTTEAAIVLRFDLTQLAALTNNVNTALYDSGSYLRIFYKTGTIDDKRDSGFDLVLFPLDTDRFRLGYLYDISWGGTAQYINQSIFPRIQGSAPGAKLQYTGSNFYAFAGFKTAQITQVQSTVNSADLDVVHITETNYGFLGGGGVDFTENVRLDAGLGYFQQGRMEQTDVLGQPVYTYGGSGRLVIHDRMPVPASVDFALYRNDPNAPMVIFRREEYTPGRVSWAVTAEGTRLEQNLKNFDRSGATTLQGATAAALQGTVKAGYARAQLTGIYRDLNFIMRNQPGYIPFSSLPSDAVVRPEFFVAGAVDYFIDQYHLTPGVGAGVQLPATFHSDSTDILGNDIGSTQVVRQQGNLSNLPRGKDRVPIVQARVSLRWDMSDMMAAIAWGQLVRDNNATRLERASDGTTFQRQFVSPDFVGFGVSVQARF